MIAERESNVNSNDTVHHPAHISGITRGIDASLSKLSQALLNLDPESQIVLGLIGKGEGMTEYQLGVKCKLLHDFSRFTVRRRIYGSGSFRGLKELDYVSEKVGAKHYTGKPRRIFDLTFKGVIGSISKVQFRKSKMIKDLHHFISKLTDNEYSIADLSLAYWNLHLAFVLSWMNMIGFTFARENDLTPLFSIDMIRLMRDTGFLSSNINEEDFGLFCNLGTRYYALLYAVVGIIDKLTEENSPLYEKKQIRKFLQTVSSGHKKRVLKESLDSWIIINWAFYADNSRLTPLDPENPYTVSYLDPVVQYVYWDETKIQKFTKRIMDKIEVKIKKVHIDYLFEREKINVSGLYE